MARKINKVKFVPWFHPDGDWGWFNYYNPITNEFALYPMYDDGNSSVENWDIYRFYQQTTLPILFPKHKDKFQLHEFLPNRTVKMLLDKLNHKVSILANKMPKFKKNGVFEFWDIAKLQPEDMFTKSQIKTAEDLWNKENKEVLFKEYIAIQILLLVEKLIKECSFMGLEDLYFIINRLEYLLNVLGYNQNYMYERRFEEFKSLRGTKNAKLRFEKNYAPIKTFALNSYQKALEQNLKVKKIKVAKQILQEIENGAVKNPNGQQLRLASENPIETILKWLPTKKCVC